MKKSWTGGDKGEQTIDNHEGWVRTSDQAETLLNLADLPCKFHMNQLKISGNNRSWLNGRGKA